MNSDFKGLVVGTLAASFVWVIVLFSMLAGWAERFRELRAKAVERGAAEWVVDPKTGDTTFTWKEMPSK